MFTTDTYRGMIRATCDCGKVHLMETPDARSHICPLTGERVSYRAEGYVPPPRKEKPPTILQQAKNFAKAAVQHVACGRPQATDDQVAIRFEICQGCELFKDTQDGTGRCLHPSCGCSLKKVGVKGLNKLRWADQACPLKKWLPVPVKSPPVPPDML
jgi:hypothetical protein